MWLVRKNTAIVFSCALVTTAVKDAVTELGNSFAVFYL